MTIKNYGHALEGNVFMSLVMEIPMALRQFFLTGLTTTILVALAGRTGLAFEVTPSQPGDSEGTYKYSQRYDFRRGETTLDAWEIPDPRRFLSPGQVLSVEVGGTQGLLQRLAEFNSTIGDDQWKFVPSGNLEGSFNIQNYFACGSDFPCRPEGGPGPSSAVGAYFKFNYIPKGNDPIGSGLHWIQRIILNYDVKDGEVVNDQIPIDKLDILGSATTPYYDVSYPIAQVPQFIDVPFIQPPYTSKDHYFYAETYLARELPSQPGESKKTVQIFNGVRWGWENKYTPYGYYTDTLPPVNGTINPIAVVLNGGRLGFQPPNYSGNDDGSFGPIPLGYSLNYFGNTYTDFYLNNNGNISFGNSVRTYTPETLFTQALAPMIAPYWADVDTRGTGNVFVRQDIPNQTIVTWDKVGYYNNKSDKTASFQLVLRGPEYQVPQGEGNIGFFYRDVNWETGDASGGSGGFGGVQAAAGYTDGLSQINIGELTLPGSQQEGISQKVSNQHFWFNLNYNTGQIQGSSQQNPILANQQIGQDRYLFRNVFSGAWVDPPTQRGFKYTMLSPESKFTKILGFPTGFSRAFSISVGEDTLGEFISGNTLDFESLLGHGVSSFTLTPIDPILLANNSHPLPLQLGFNTANADFEILRLSNSDPTSVPEPSSMLGVLTIGLLGVHSARKHKHKRAL